MWSLVLLFGCDEDERQLRADVEVALASPAPAEPAYAARKEALGARREELAARYAAATARERGEIVEEARAAALQGVTRELIPAWYGTPWAFYGVTETPREGTIACGYFVSTVLRDAGFGVERVRMAQQASERIILSLVPRAAVRRYSSRPVEEVVSIVREGGESLWLVGLDSHVGFLWNDGEAVWMCHSSYLGSSGVVCEDAIASPAMESGYRVVGRLFADPMMEAWLEGRAIPTVTR